MSDAPTLFEPLGVPDEDPFAVVRGVPLDVLTAEAADAPVDYLRVASATTRSREFRAFRKAVGPLALAWWVGLLIIAKRDGVFGLLDIDAADLSLEATGTVDHDEDVPRVLDALDRAGLVWVRHLDGVATVRVRRWAAWQSSTPRERTRLSRARRGDPVTPRRDTDTPARDTDTSPRDMSHHVDIDDTPMAAAFASAPEPARVHVREDAPPVDARAAFLASMQPLVDAFLWMHRDDPGQMERVRDEVGVHRRKSGHDLASYERAAVALGRKFADGWRPRAGHDVFGYYFTTIPSHRHAPIELPDPDPKDPTDDRPPTLRRNPDLAAFD